MIPMGNDDRSLIPLLAEVGRELVRQNQKAFAIRLIEAAVRAQSYDRAVGILEKNLVISWPEPAHARGGYWL